jgi:hypothetical protein
MSSGIDGIDRIEELSEFLRSLPGRTKGKGMELAAAAVQKVALAEYAAGQGPEGKPWPRRKIDGAVPLQRPAAELQFIGGGGAIRSTTADEPVLDHHRGRRPVYPRGSMAKQLPATWLRAAEGALRKYIEDLARRAAK